MEEGPSILPDIEAVTPSHHHQQHQHQQVQLQRREMYTLPLTAFNVDSLGAFKPLICVDGGFVAAAAASSDDLKAAAHIVIQQPSATGGGGGVASSQPPELTPAAANRSAAESWATAIAEDVLPIRCKSTTGELHKAKFGSGGRGRCIARGKTWYTPIEFEAACGRGSSKDWKRSLRYGGHSVQRLIEEGVLTLHASSCTCATCYDDSSAAVPVRFFVPYKRRRRNEDGNDKSGDRKRSDGGGDESDTNGGDAAAAASPSKKERAWRNLADGLVDVADECPALETVVEMRHRSEADELAARLDELVERAAKHYGEFRACVDEVRALAASARDDRRRRREGPPPVGGGDKRCSNCNREASSECSLCRRASYCSTFCQKKDWAAHQMECVRLDAGGDHQSQSIMLIVENPEQ